MMTTSVRVEDDTKHHLDRLQGIVQAREGQKVSHNELLRRLLRFTESQLDRFLGAPGWTPPDREDIEAFLAEITETDEYVLDSTEIDAVLYGDRRR